jgi:hypothetical protein
MVLTERGTGGLHPAQSTPSVAWQYSVSVKKERYREWPPLQAHVKLGTDHSPQTEMPKLSTIIVCTPYRHQQQKAPLTHPAGLSPAMTFYAGKIQVEEIVRNRPWTTFILCCSLPPYDPCM